MFDENVTRVLREIKPDDLVLDIGGWARPFNRANYVIDQYPYDTRGTIYRQNYGLAPQGGDREHFSRDTWITRDICGREPYPFSDKSVDYVICSHTLEDVRDPIWVCSEMNRVGRRGYLEVPSREYESSVSFEAPRMAGAPHHRWLIEIDQSASVVTFEMKYHLIHTRRRYHLPEWYRWKLKPKDEVQALFWEGSFTASETAGLGEADVAKRLERYVRAKQAYPEAFYFADDLAIGVRGRVMRRLGKLRLLIHGS